jgi:hypothetical protein
LQKLRKKEIEMKRAENARDEWFNRVRPMTSLKRTWREKRLAKEECSDNEETDHGSSESTRVNMVFVLPGEFRAPDREFIELALGAKVESLEKLEQLGQHMRPLFVQGHLEGRPVQRIMVDGGTDLNVMPLTMLKRMGYQEDELMKTNTKLSTFTGEVTTTKGVLSVELTTSSKTLPTTFFMVDVKGRYNLLLGRDWIHVNGCVPCTLHQCLIQWVGDEVEVVLAEGPTYVVATEVDVEPMDGEVAWLSGRDLSEYNYISVGKDGFVPVNMKLMNTTRLNSLGSQ